VRLGRDGAEGVLPLGPMSAHERAGFAKMLEELKGSIDKGVHFANK
jgi:malate dehydrogenase